MSTSGLGQPPIGGSCQTGRPSAQQWKVVVATIISGCSAVLFVIGAAVALGFGGRIAWELRRDHRDDQAALGQARADCAGRYDPEEWRSPQQQFDGCVADRMEPWTWRGEVHPLVFLLVAGPYLLYMGITGLTGFLAWDYRRDRRSRQSPV
jgi:hypothetical protein